MRFRITCFTVLVGALFLAWSPSSFAAMPSGIMVFEFNHDNIYDLSRFTDCESDSELRICLAVKMMPNGRGKHSGTATIKFSGIAKGTLQGPASGSVNGETGGKGKGKLKFATKGKLKVRGAPGKHKSTFDADCSGNISATGSYKPTCKVKFFIKGGGTVKGKEKPKFKLKGGAWALTVELNQLNAKKLTGTATDTLGYKYDVEGKYSAGEDTSEVEVIGRNKISKGAKVVLKGLTETGAAKAKFKVQGYKGSAQIQALPP